MHPHDRNPGPGTPPSERAGLSSQKGAGGLAPGHRRRRTGREQPVGRRGLREVSFPLLFGTALLCSIIATPPAAAQTVLGAHGVRASEALGGAEGIGLRLGTEFSFLPAELLVGGEYMFVSCEHLDACGFTGGSLDANVKLPFPIPFVRPYATAGLSLRRFDPQRTGTRTTSTGPHLGAGLRAGVPGVRLFGEGRYEFLPSPERQFIVRVGVLLGGW